MIKWLFAFIPKRKPHVSKRVMHEFTKDLQCDNTTQGAFEDAVLWTIPNPNPRRQQTSSLVCWKPSVLHVLSVSLLQHT